MKLSPYPSEWTCVCVTSFNVWNEDDKIKISLSIVVVDNFSTRNELEMRLTLIEISFITIIGSTMIE